MKTHTSEECSVSSSKAELLKYGLFPGILMILLILVIGNASDYFGESESWSEFDMDDVIAIVLIVIPPIFAAYLSKDHPFIALGIILSGLLLPAGMYNANVPSPTSSFFTVLLTVPLFVTLFGIRGCFARGAKEVAANVKKKVEKNGSTWRELLLRFGLIFAGLVFIGYMFPVINAMIFVTSFIMLVFPVTTILGIQGLGLSIAAYFAAFVLCMLTGQDLPSLLVLDYLT